MYVWMYLSTGDKGVGEGREDLHLGRWILRTWHRVYALTYSEETVCWWQKKRREKAFHADLVAYSSILYIYIYIPILTASCVRLARLDSAMARLPPKSFHSCSLWMIYCMQ